MIISVPRLKTRIHRLLWNYHYLFGVSIGRDGRGEHRGSGGRDGRVDTASHSGGAQSTTVTENARSATAMDDAGLAVTPVGRASGRAAQSETTCTLNRGAQASSSSGDAENCYIFKTVGGLTIVRPTATACAPSVVCEGRRARHSAYGMESVGINPRKGSLHESVRTPRCTTAEGLLYSCLRRTRWQWRVDYTRVVLVIAPSFVWIIQRAAVYLLIGG